MTHDVSDWLSNVAIYVRNTPPEPTSGSHASHISVSIAAVLLTVGFATEHTELV